MADCTIRIHHYSLILFTYTYKHADSTILVHYSELDDYY